MRASKKEKLFHTFKFRRALVGILLTLSSAAVSTIFKHFSNSHESFSKIRQLARCHCQEARTYYHYQLSWKPILITNAYSLQNYLLRMLSTMYLSWGDAELCKIRQGPGRSAGNRNYILLRQSSIPCFVSSTLPSAYPILRVCRAPANTHSIRDAV
jgi:hypothetical protein